MIFKSNKNTLNPFQRPSLKVKVSNPNCTFLIDKIKQGPENIPAVINVGFKYRDNQFSEIKMLCKDWNLSMSYCANYYE
jgi:hypothetical protein